MSRSVLAAALAACLLPALAVAAPAAKHPAKPTTSPSSKEILDAAPASAWHVPAADTLLYMDVPAGRVVIELAPQFAPAHVDNIRALAHGRFWDGLAIYRSQDNYVVQFGDPDADEPGKARPFPAGAKAHLPAEFDRSTANLPFVRLPDVDGWAPQVGFSGDFPAARDPKSGRAWMTHCYGTLGAGRGNPADSSTGAELYVATGESPRALDRNITVVGRVLKGMEYLSAIPRGPAPMGFFTDPVMRVPIKSIRLASEVPEADRVPIEVLRTDTPTFTRLMEAKRNRHDDWYKRPPGHVGVCSVAPLVRTPPAH